jgi:DNA processing protein
MAAARRRALNAKVSRSRETAVDILDPREPAHEPELAHWLAVQRAYAFRPEQLPAGLRQEATGGLPSLGVPTLPVAERARILRVLAQAGVRLVPIASPRYPARLRRLTDPPPLLAIRGSVACLGMRAVAIVGARAASAYGLRMAQGLASDLARAGLLVLSGLARGIDARVHEAALEAGGLTTAFQACGPERVYPASHRRLADRIAASGSVVSELPVGTPPRAPYFPLRNRLISALSEAVVVVEARIRSGSLVTARHAADQGVDVFAVPGPVGPATSEGPHQLLRDGAGLAASSADVLRALGLEEAPLRAPAAAEPQDPRQRRVLVALREAPAATDALAVRLDLSPAAVGALLVGLEIDGHVQRDRDGSWAPTSPAATQKL